MTPSEGMTKTGSATEQTAAFELQRSRTMDPSDPELIELEGTLSRMQ